MVDFKRHIRKEKVFDVSNLITVFESLDRQTSHIELRPVQGQALELLSKNRNKKDIILKISTGSGKTSVALLFLFSHMLEKGLPVLYLCPTVQLVKQVIDEATKLGIEAVEYPKGQQQPDVKGISGKAIIVCTYDKLFNAKSTFNRPDVQLRPSAIVCDDAHAGIEEIRDAFTLKISNDDDIYKRIINLLTAPCEEYNLSKWHSIEKQDPYVSFEVPYWIIHSLHSELHEILASESHSDNFIFVWPHLMDILKRCRLIISSLGIEILPDIIPVHKVEAFVQASYRLFMSATLADDSVLVRELGCAPEAAIKPLLPYGDKGLGERMVLVPSLVDTNLNRTWVMNICEQLSKKLNVVVLSPSEWTANEWESAGATVFMGDAVLGAVEQLKSKSPSTRFVVFVQRYDGVDLPDNACRVLVLDGMPYGEGIADKFDSSITAIPGGTRNRIVYRIEQGMGRAVRSHVDYAVVILSGYDLGHFIAKGEVIAAMNPDTRAQLRLALDLAELAKEDVDDSANALIEMIKQCLNRDDGWKQYYVEYMSKSREERPELDATRINLAEAERKAFELSLSNQFDRAANEIREALDNLTLSDNDKGLYLQKIASYMYEINQGDALETQLAARVKNIALFCPPNIKKRPHQPLKMDDVGRILSWFAEFENPNGAISAVEDLRARLSYDVPVSAFEEAICDLAPLLGAEGHRPEKEEGEGPDDLWLWTDISLVIEAKNENKKSLHKKDSGQLHTSLEWFKKYYKMLPPPVPVVAARVFIADKGSHFPEGTRVITPDNVTGLLNNLKAFYNAIINEPPLQRNPYRISELQAQHMVDSKQFISKYTTRLKELKK